MTKKANSNLKKIMTVLGVSTIAVGLISNTVYADSPSDNKSQEYQEGLKEHQDLQAYNYPLVAAELTTDKGELPAAESGVSNWTSLPAGTTAYWHKQPEINQVGKSYGTIIVTFPDKSASVIAVYVTVKADSSEDAPNQKSEINTSELKKATAAAQEQADAKNKAALSAVKSSEKNESNSESQTESTDASSDAATNNANDQVIVKNVKTVYNKPNEGKQETTTKNDQISNTVAPNNTELPRTQAKQSNLVIIGGVMTVFVGLVATVFNKFKFEK
ncbi:Rib/alpha/Esp surface antigen-like repeat protein [Lactobacillus colini]|uniref:Rib/alpha/Esp surface antigen-like repeat protein n=1 Tax=Lactobacillus colini TaxID=1819254 RepID=A0ABS4ME88_9LACO|nr:Rib/alpha-like domain-containing protein [Lactobacillus colini]MBP2057959.1 Rib/alpha/Esp surface antigen-like repeat protein [Lactobacillus colini]